MDISKLIHVKWITSRVLNKPSSTTIVKKKRVIYFSFLKDDAYAQQLKHVIYFPFLIKVYIYILTFKIKFVPFFLSPVYVFVSKKKKRMGNCPILLKRVCCVLCVVYLVPLFLKSYHDF